MTLGITSFSVLTLLLLPATVSAQDPRASRTLPIDPSAATRLLYDMDHWRWLTAEHPDAAVVFSARHEILIVADGTHGVVAFEEDEVMHAGLRDATLARCSATTPDGDRQRAQAEATNLCDQIAAETMPRATRLRGYAYQIVLVDIFSGPAFPFASPVVHLIHRRPMTALASLGVRLGAIGGGLLTGLGIAVALPPQAFEATGAIGGSSANYLPQMFAGLMIGAATGVIAATIFDAAYLARERYGLPSPAWQF